MRHEMAVLGIYPLWDSFDFLICKFMSFVKLGEFLAIVFWGASQLLSLFLLSLHIANDAMLYSPRPLRLCSHFFSVIIFTLFFRLGHFYRSFF